MSPDRIAEVGAGKGGRRMKLPFEKGRVRLTSPYGNRTLNGQNNFHGGIDLVGVDTDQVVAACAGVVAQSTMITDKGNLTWQWGNYVRVDGKDGKRYYYCHLASRAVKVGQTVQEGDHIGVMGNTGYSFGRHLHFEVRSGNNGQLQPAPLLGIANAEGVYNQPDYRAEVLCATEMGEAFGKHLDKYAYSDAAWYKIWRTIKNK